MWCFNLDYEFEIESRKKKKQCWGVNRTPRRESPLLGKGGLRYALVVATNDVVSQQRDRCGGSRNLNGSEMTHKNPMGGWLGMLRRGGTVLLPAPSLDLGCTQVGERKGDSNFPCGQLHRYRDIGQLPGGKNYRIKR